MRLDVKKIAILLVYLLGLFYFFRERFDDADIALAGVGSFFLVYMIVLYLAKRKDGRIFKSFVFTHVRCVDAKTILDVEPHVRGILIFGDIKLFSRVSVNVEGIFIYKQGVYSFFVPWGDVLITDIEKQPGFATLTMKADRQCHFLLPWSTTFENYLR